MSLKQELEINSKAIAAYDKENYDEALTYFQRIEDTGSKIRFNIGLIYATLGYHEPAVKQFQEAIKLDRYLAIAYFQQGVSNFLLGEYDLAKDNFNEALVYLRGNPLIDYQQLGLKFRLYSCEVLFNRGLCFMYLRSIEDGLVDLEIAAREKQIEEHDVIDEALRDKGDGYTVFSIPVGILYRPDESKVRNMAVRDYLGKARLIAATDARDVGTGFRGFEKKSEERAYDLPAATPRGSSQHKSIRPLLEVMPTSQHVLPLSMDKQVRDERNKPLPGFDFDIERRPSLASTSRGLFPAPSRSNSIALNSVRSLPSTPPQESRTTNSVNNSASSSANSLRKDSSSSSSSRSTGRQDSSASSLRSRESSYDPLYRGRSNRIPPFPVKMSQNEQKAPQASVKESRSRKDSDASVYEEIVPFPDRSHTNSITRSMFTSSVASIEDSEPVTPQYRSRTKEKKSETEFFRPRKSYTLDQPRTGVAGYRNLTPPSSSDYDDILDNYYEEADSVSPRKILARGSRIRKIVCKIYGLEDTRKMVMEPFLHLKDFQDKLMAKFQWTNLPKLRVKDEDGEMILLEDQDDLDDACEMAVLRAQRANKDVGNVELWVKAENSQKHY